MSSGFLLLAVESRDLFQAEKEITSKFTKGQLLGEFGIFVKIVFILKEIA